MSRVKRGCITALAALLSVQFAMPAGNVHAVDNTERKGYIAQVQTGAHWAQASIDRWLVLGVVQGYPDGSFHPNEKVTRAELAAIINRLFGYTDKAEVPFADIPQGAWYGETLSLAKAAGYYEGFPGNLSKATAYISRQDAVTLISKAFSLKNESATNPVSFTDAAEISGYAREH